MCNKDYYYDSNNNKCIKFNPNNKSPVIINNNIPYKCPPGCY